MKRLLVFFITFLIFFTYTIQTFGSGIGEGARAISMGGAFTAIADDGTAPYWNPAGITQIKFALTPTIGLQGNWDSLSNIMNKLSDNELPTTADLQNQQFELDGLMGFATRHVALSGYTESFLTSAVDSAQNLDLKLQSYNYGVLTIAFNINKDLAIGLNLKEVEVAYAEAFIPYGYGSSATQLLNSNYSLEQAENIIENLLTSTAFASYGTGDGSAVDLGVLYHPSSQVSLGFTARNIISNIQPQQGSTYQYRWDQSTGQPVLTNSNLPYSYATSIPQEYVLGVSYRPSDSWILASDVELIDIPDLNSETRLHFGAEKQFFGDKVSLRAGAFTVQDEPLYFTGGLGFKLGPVVLDLAAVDMDTGDDAYFVTFGLKF